ncbi:MAG TPA: hypothetical protein VGS01_07580 [Candidatus Limnocylindria bacterium]|nr:hypothetical protein [Candidatus Limnocylindria bacterium]
MTRIAPAIAAVLLIAIGAGESSISARQLAESVGRPRLDSAGLMLTAAGLLTSAAIYLVLGHLADDDRAALRTGAMTGAFAGLVGGTVRALIIGGVVADLVARYAAVPEWFVPTALAVFVGLSGASSAAAGGALCWTGRRLSRAARSRPRA